MTITNNSPLQTLTGSTIYINDLDFDPRLFFTDSGTTIYYILLRKDVDYTRVIQTGVLQGYNNGTDYSYIFNFNNSIKIDNQSDLIFTNVDSTGSLKFDGNNSSTLTLCIDNVDLLSANKTAGHLTTLTNGEVILTTGQTTSQIVCDNIFEYKFSDKNSDSDILLETNIIAEENKYISITIYDGVCFYNFFNINNKIIIPTTQLQKTTNYDYTVYLLRIPQGTNYIGLEGYDNSGFQLFSETILINNKCYNNYYFWNTNGAFDSIHCKGNNNIIDTVNKNKIQVGNKIIYTDIEIKKQIKQNSGFELTQEQIYGLLESPNVYKIIEESNTVTSQSINTEPSDWTVTIDWTYSNGVWYANNSDYSYLMSPIISTEDYGLTYTVKFEATIDNADSYFIQVQDYDAVEYITTREVLAGVNQFTFTCDVSVEHLKIMFFGNSASSGNIQLKNILIFQGTNVLPILITNPYYNQNLVNDSLLDLTSNAYGFGELPITLLSGITYTLSVNGYISETAYNNNEFLRVMIYDSGFVWSLGLDIYSGISTTKTLTFVAPHTGLYHISSFDYPHTYPSDVHINWYKVELGSVATPWTLSIDNYLPNAKQYIIDNTTFEGYNGITYGNKNIELVFSDPYVYKRKTNKNITFYD